MTWKAYIQINAMDTSNYFIEDFEVTDEQYRALTEAVANNIPINELDIYDEVYELAEDAADYEAVVDKWPGVESEDECTLADVIVDDPGDFERFKQRYIGRPLEENEFFEIEEDFDRFITYSVDIQVEEQKIAEIYLGVCAIEYFSFRRNYDSDDAYPNYDLLQERLDELLNINE